MPRLAVFVLATVLLAAGTASAQDRGDVSGGYRFLRSEGVNFGAGWYVDVAGHLTDVVSVVGDVGGTYKSLSETIQGITISADVQLHTFMGGARFRAAMLNRRIVPFGQVLFGAGNATTSASGGGISISESSTDGAMMFSGGVDVNGSGSLGVRVQAGVLRDFSDDASNIFQFSIGARIGF